MRRARSVLLLVMIALSACAAQRPARMPATEGSLASAAAGVPVDIAYRGDQCRETNAGTDLLRSSEAVGQWWQRVASLYLPVPALPATLGELDFSRWALLIVYLGDRPTPGYSIDLSRDSGKLEGGVLVIEAILETLSPGSVLPQVMTSPCIALRVPAGGWSTVIVRDQNGRTISRYDGPKL